MPFTRHDMQALERALHDARKAAELCESKVVSVGGKKLMVADGALSKNRAGYPRSPETVNAEYRGYIVPALLVFALLLALLAGCAFGLMPLKAHHTLAVIGSIGAFMLSVLTVLYAFGCAGVVREWRQELRLAHHFWEM